MFQFNDNPQNATERLIDISRRLYAGMIFVVVTVKFAEIVTGKRMTP